MLGGVFYAEKNRAMDGCVIKHLRCPRAPALPFLRYPRTLISSTVKQRVAWGAMASPAPWAP